MNSRGRIASIVAAVATIALVASTARAGNFTEVIDVGGNKAGAQVVANWGNGEFITGTVTAQSDLDYYRVSAPIAAPAIYRHRVNLTMGSGGRASTRGTGVNGGGADVNFNSDRLNGEFLTWYSFGNGGEMYMRANRTTSGSNTYTMTQNLSTVTPLNVGTLPQGSHTLASPLLSDSEIYLYDSNFALLGQNDSQTGGNVQASMVFNFTTNGSYYVAIGSGNSSTYVGAFTVPQAYSNVTTDPFYDSNFGGGARATILDFQNVVSRPENLSRTAAEFALRIDGGTPINYSGAVGGQEMAWYRIDIVPEPASLALLGLAGVAVSRRRRMA